jgi:hypothetical protein
MLEEVDASEDWEMHFVTSLSPESLDGTAHQLPLEIVTSHDGLMRIANSMHGFERQRSQLATCRDSEYTNVGMRRSSAGVALQRVACPLADEVGGELGLE